MLDTEKAFNDVLRGLRSRGFGRDDIVKLFVYHLYQEEEYDQAYRHVQQDNATKEYVKKLVR